MTGDDACVDAFLVVFLLDLTECDSATLPVISLRVIVAFGRWGQRGVGGGGGCAGS